VPLDLAIANAHGARGTPSSPDFAFSSKNRPCEVVTTLLNKDAGIGFRTDKKGQTALHMASKGQKFGTTFILVDDRRQLYAFSHGEEGNL